MGIVCVCVCGGGGGVCVCVCVCVWGGGEVKGTRDDSKNRHGAGGGIGGGVDETLSQLPYCFASSIL